ncbi:hypothetical protein FFLO_06359 [Filobasidium floriforme]|uniref:Uncharacterized protein n=1 Tax=Filobasidium floriforme TaxID=5210 RepID=A0A8K0NKM8_9TREE|nr:uncharacterized protein HD553DRAFT_370624 [Filobasidium floriforme]KAG7528188.1 hypothetical protein FFLO_06359 [Filobasidium floriforme]KAH8085907.1 hypothetical protein HD553DRAFT_370624 [Filobasidium floriforme]
MLYRPVLHYRQSQQINRSLSLAFMSEIGGLLDARLHSEHSVRVAFFTNYRQLRDTIAVLLHTTRISFAMDPEPSTASLLEPSSEMTLLHSRSDPPNSSGITATSVRTHGDASTVDYHDQAARARGVAEISRTLAAGIRDLVSQKEFIDIRWGYRGELDEGVKRLVIYVSSGLQDIQWVVRLPDFSLRVHDFEATQLASLGGARLSELSKAISDLGNLESRQINSLEVYSDLRGKVLRLAEQVGEILRRDPVRNAELDLREGAIVVSRQVIDKVVKDLALS